MNQGEAVAPGGPGVPPRWTSSAKSGVGTALSNDSRVWFTLSHGIVNEIYYPRVDQACTRDMGLIVTDGEQFFSEEKRHADHRIEYLEDGVPAYRCVNTCAEGHYRIEKQILTDPHRATLLQQTRFQQLKAKAGQLHLYVLLAPHLGNRGSANNAWLADYKGVPMLFAERDGVALALACSAPWSCRSVGFVGSSDGWQDLMKNKRMTWFYDRAENGNVALCGEIDVEAASDGTFLLALGFGRNPSEAALRARASLVDGFESARSSYVEGWRKWHSSLRTLPKTEQAQTDLYRISASVMRIHEAKRFGGGLIASLAIPWGFAKGDDDLGGYHLVWPRDLVETAGGLLALGAREDAHRVLHYLMVTQEGDGHWAQNMWLDGSEYWVGVQMDETAFPILLLDLARRKGRLEDDDTQRFWPMLRKAAAYLVCNGPVTQQDRWEEDPGYSPFTLAVEVAALLAAADLADLNGEPQTAGYLRETADTWNANIERWTYVIGTDLARQLDVEGYYVRIAPPETAEGPSPAAGFVPIKNRPPGSSTAPETHIISPDALALVRFGLRKADDARILNTVKVIDALLKVQTPFGPAWHRYNEDGYGEHDDGSPFDGTGRGRAWPLLTGERAHYELAAGHIDEAAKLLKTLEAFANEGGMISEQVWDADDIPARELYFGRPSGSAMPLVWAHAEYVKLRRSLREGKVFDMPPQTVRRYCVEETGSSYSIWRRNHKCRDIPRGTKLRIELLSPAVVLWSTDGWKKPQELRTRDTGVGVHLADLPTTDLPPGTEVRFRFRGPHPEQPAEEEFIVKVSA